MPAYIALIHKDADSDFGVSFPDFPGCFTAGSTLDEARTMAEEALALHIRGMEDDGEAVPEPASLDAVMADPENRDGGVAVLVPVPARTTRAMRINITLPAEVLEQIDRYAETHGYSRSGFMVAAAKKAIRDAA